MAIVLFQLNPNLFLRDPQSTELGKRILRESVKMIDKIGFDDFTFRKLGKTIRSPEASVYRYFENKHKLLLYLSDWYWTWLEYQMDIENRNLASATSRIRNCIRLLVEEKKNSPETPFVDQNKLQRIVFAEFEKTYLTRTVDIDNKEGLFLPYKSVCRKIATIIAEVNSDYKFPHALVSTVMLSANHQLYYADHLPSLTEVKSTRKHKHNDVTDFLTNMVFKTIGLQ